MKSDVLKWLDCHVNREATAGQVKGVDLERMRRLTKLLGEPQRDYPVIHITGTNGKGSTAYLLSRLLEGLGLRVGTYTSPHVSSLYERIQLGCEPIEGERFADLLGDVRLVTDEIGVEASWFEIVTAAGLRCFSDEAVDVAVLEVGKLGRFDATNVVDAEVAVVTNVGEDHTDGRSQWRQAVAWEKSGIVKRGCKLVLGEIADDLEPVFAAPGPREIRRLGEHFDCSRNDLAVGGRVLEMNGEGRYEEVFLSLHGAHQGRNAALAVASVEAFLEGPLPAEVVEEAFGSVGFPGRFEALGRSPLVLADGAHNPDGGKAARTALEEDFSDAEHVYLVLGMMRDKDPRKMLTALGAERCDLVITTTAPSPRAIPARELAEIASAAGLRCEAVEDTASAVRRAAAMASGGSLVLVTGSLYVAGAARDGYGAAR